VFCDFPLFIDGGLPYGAGRFDSMPSVFIKTYGCQMNERDSEAVAARFVARGYTLAPSEATADVILLNTCSVRDAAEQKALGKMAALADTVRRERPRVLLGYLGCMAQSRGEQLLDRKLGVTLVLGTQKLHRAPDCVDDLLAGRCQTVCDTASDCDSQAVLRDHVFPAGRAGASPKAFVSIMQGCNQHCSFCIVPHTRGAERSRTIEDIVAECRDLTVRGVREVTLLGQIVTSYGRREIPVRNGLTPFVQLLEAVNAIDGLERIRFTSPHPKGYGNDLVQAYGRLGKLCENAHLPAQSGSDRLLRAMHRGYTRGRYLDLVDRLRRVSPEISITTDLIVGFPGETEEDFEDTMALARDVEFDNAFLFKYSPRRDTPAAARADQVPRKVREERLARLLDAINAIAARKLQDMVNRRVQILVEGLSRRNKERLEGRTRGNQITVFEGPPRLIGQLLDVRINRASAFTLHADPPIPNPN